MIRKLAITALVAFAALVGPAATKTAAADGAPEAKKIKVGTLAPKNSEWGKYFSAWRHCRGGRPGRPGADS